MSDGHHYVRRAEANDMATVCALIRVCVLRCKLLGFVEVTPECLIRPQELSNAENVSEKAQLTETDLIRDGGFDPKSNAPPRFICFVVVDQLASSIVGYALAYLKTFTLKRRTLFVDSLFIQPAAGELVPKLQRLLIEKLKDFAVRNECFRLDAHVQQHSDLAPIWQSMGAVDITSSQDVRHLRLHSDAIAALVA